MDKYKVIRVIALSVLNGSWVMMAIGLIRMFTVKTYDDYSVGLTLFLIIGGFVALFIGALLYHWSKGPEGRRAEYLETLRVLREREEAHQIFIANNIPCPVCGSKETKRISTANRATSIFIAGLASSKIGKQYECLNCKHKW